MSERDESVEQRMERLARATEPLRARPGFELKVMAQIQASAAARGGGWLADVLAASRRAFIPAALAAVAGLALAVVGEPASGGEPAGIGEETAALAADYGDSSDYADVDDLDLESDW